jgi:ABC-type multidrug transport system fused ATPase/permease subunit
MKTSNFIKFNWVHRLKNLGLGYRSAVILIILSIVATFAEVLGIGIFLPIFQFIRLNGDLDALVGDSSVWEYIIDFLYYFNIKLSLVPLLLLSFSLFISRQVFTYLRLVYSMAVKQRMIQIQRNRIFNGYMDANTSYHDSVPVGNFVNIVITEVGGAVAGVLAPIELLVYIVMFLGYFIMLSILSWQMTLVSTVVILFASAIPKIWIKQSADVGRKLVNANIVMTEFLVGRLRSPRLVRLSGTEDAEKDEFYRLTRAQRKHSVFVSILASKTEVAMEPVIVGGSLIFLYLSHTVLQMQVEVIGLYLVVVMRLIPVVKGIVKGIQNIQTQLGSIEIIENRFKVLKESPEQDNGNRHLVKIKKYILIDNVSYRYPETERYALKNITIKFRAHTMTAIVGPSGGGKSTLIDLLPRLRLPVKGVIQIDGENIEKYRLKSVRQLISYVPQSPQIFNGTVKNHILYGNINATDEEMKEAICLSGSQDFINQLSNGVDTVLGEDAVKLSGGQRQRLDLARALVRKSKILILDEPTSNLDAESEEMFKQTLARIRKEKVATIIVVAHRLASIADADQIIVLNQGRVESIGVHKDLLKQKGWYCGAWKIQESI